MIADDVYNSAGKNETGGKMRYEYCERDIGEMEDRLHATEARAEAMERFCTPTLKVETITPDNMYWHELLLSLIHI